MSLRIGNLLGAENPREAALAAQVAVLLAFIAAFILRCASSWMDWTVSLTALCSTIYMVFRDSWGYIFNNDIEVIRQVALIMPLMALSGVFDGLASVTGGIMRAKGQQEVGAILNIITYYVIGLPIGVLLAFKYSMGLSGLWVGLTIAAMGTGFYGVYSKPILISFTHHKLIFSRLRLFNPFRLGIWNAEGVQTIRKRSPETYKLIRIIAWCM